VPCDVYLISCSFIKRSAQKKHRKDQAGKNPSQSNLLQPSHPLNSICAAQRRNVDHEFW